jgi:nucleoid DNA-binding protein
MANKPDQDLIDSMVSDVINQLSLQEKVKIANLSQFDVHVLEATMGKYLKHRGGKLLDSEKDIKEINSILREVWKRLRETHRLKVVK